MNDQLVRLTEAQALYYDYLKRLRGQRGTLLELLLDGEWHSNHKCASVGGLSFNDSIFAFRQEGWQIESRHVRGGRWEFRLLGKSAPTDGHKPMTRPQRLVATTYMTAIQQALGTRGQRSSAQRHPHMDAPRSADIAGRGSATVNLCTACNQDFGSLTAFDRHRTGRHAYPHSEEQPDGRRCLKSDELLDKGFRLDIRGRWRLPRRGTAPWDQ
jgi:hypothetical protein